MMSKIKFEKVGELFCGPGGSGIGSSLSNEIINDTNVYIRHIWAADYDQDSCITYKNNIEKFENKNHKYCNINGTCTKMEGENCGVNELNGQYNSIFNSLEECTNDSLVCEKYNKSNRSKEENKTECLKDVKCGYCNNNDKCVIGTAEGPNNMELNYACIPNLNYEYGDHATYII